MNLHKFIYAEKGPFRYYRHILFWGVAYILILLSDALTTFILQDTYTLTQSTLLECATDLLGEVIYTYFMAYYILPRYFFKKKYTAFITLSILSTLLIYSALILTDHQFEAPGQPLDLSFPQMWSQFWAYTGYGPAVVCAVFVILKTVKEYSRTMEEKETLIRENAKAEALLLKTQVHPHFLFNTLNNIYAFAITRPGLALRLTESLSSTIQYMTNECSEEFVPLEKEIRLIRDYIRLEKVRYGRRLRARMTVQGDATNKQIAPLLLIPLVENCFKHGASQLFENPWVKVHIFIEDALLRAEITNSKPELSTQSEKKGIGLANVRKRLELLYTGNHLLKICPGDDSFTVSIQIPLHRSLVDTIHPTHG